MSRILSTALLLAAGIIPAASAHAQAVSAPFKLLDVPYIQQTESLCGGAAAAMVMRYWGATGIRAESFSALVDDAGRGIRGEDLLRDLRTRGWDAQAFRGDETLVARRLAERQPIVALIEDRPGSFHFIVIVGWANGRVVYHDPARAPYRVAGAAAFDTAWEKSGRWTMLLLPPTAGHSEITSVTTVPASVSHAEAPCDALVAEGVRAAEAGDRASALNTFRAAAELCPGSSAPLRELAGVHALEENWTEAERLAREAVKRDRSDEHAWRIVATSAFVRGNAMAALAAWNAVGEPLIDLVNVIGLNKTRHSVATALLDLELETVLTTDRLAVASRRLKELPTAQLARVNYRPLGGGRATVEAAVVERSVLPTSRGALAMAGYRLLVDRELITSVAGAMGNGELISASWRWWPNRPRVAMSFEAPSHYGVWRAGAFGEEQSYGFDGLVEKRRGGAFSVAQWTAATHWELTGGIDAWNGDARTFSAGVAADHRLAGDRLSLRVGGSVLGGSFAAVTTTTAIVWQSSVRHEGTVIAGRAGFESASRKAPFALWPGAGTGQGRSILLRAHPLLDDGRITGDIFGRQVAHSGLEVQRWMDRLLKIVRIAPALFLDTAYAEDRRQPGSAWHTDAGIGLRLALPSAGVIRFDIGKGLRDGATAVSVGWVR